jgi:hypothetical protein
VEEYDDSVPEPECKAGRVVRARDGERDDEERAHSTEEEQAEAEQIGRDRIRQPRVAVVHPPDDRQHHDDVQRAGRISARDEDAGQLRDREDEDEVEEQLERRDAGAAVDRLGHCAIIAETPTCGREADAFRDLRAVCA